MKLLILIVLSAFNQSIIAQKNFPAAPLKINSTIAQRPEETTRVHLKFNGIRTTIHNGDCTRMKGRVKVNLWDNLNSKEIKPISPSMYNYGNLKRLESLKTWAILIEFKIRQQDNIYMLNMELWD